MLIEYLKLFNYKDSEATENPPLDRSKKPRTFNKEKITPVKTAKKRVRKTKSSHEKLLSPSHSGEQKIMQKSVDRGVNQERRGEAEVLYRPLLPSFPLPLIPLISSINCRLTYSVFSFINILLLVRKTFCYSFLPLNKKITNSTPVQCLKFCDQSSSVLSG